MPVLKDLRSAQGASLELRKRWAEQLSEALAAVHRRGYLHRDISPGNVLITSNMETAFLSDFGRCVLPRDRATTGTSFVGTEHFASREALSERRRPCEEDDWHALVYTVYWTDAQHKRWQTKAIHHRIDVHGAARHDPAARVVVQHMNRAV